MCSLTINLSKYGVTDFVFIFYYNLKIQISNVKINNKKKRIKNRYKCRLTDL